MSDPPPPTPPPEGEEGAGIDLFPYLPPARVQSMRRLVNLAHGLAADVGEAIPEYPVQLDAHRVLLGYLKANADAEALELKRRAVEVQEEQLAVKRADHELARERFEDGRKRGREVRSLPEVAAEAVRRARERKRERG